MKKTASSTRQAFWWEGRKWGLRGSEPNNGSVVAWVFPDRESHLDWVYLGVDGNRRTFKTHTLARMFAEGVLNDRVTWEFYRVDGKRGGFRPKAGSTR